VDTLEGGLVIVSRLAPVGHELICAHVPLRVQVDATPELSLAMGAPHLAPEDGVDLLPRWGCGDEEGIRPGVDPVASRAADAEALARVVARLDGRVAMLLDALPDLDLLRPCVLTNDLLEPEMGVACELSVLGKTNSRTVARPEWRALTCAADLSLRG
jgi:hypothetical protein